MDGTLHRGAFSNKLGDREQIVEMMEVTVVKMSLGVTAPVTFSI